MTYDIKERYIMRSALRAIWDQTEDICLEHVSKNGYELEHVKEQTKAICLAAVRESPGAILYVKEQDPEICFAAASSGMKHFEAANIKPEFRNMELCAVNLKSFYDGNFRQGMTLMGVDFRHITDVYRLNDEDFDNLGKKLTDIRILDGHKGTLSGHLDYHGHDIGIVLDPKNRLDYGRQVFAQIAERLSYDEHERAYMESVEHGSMEKIKATPYYDKLRQKTDEDPGKVDDYGYGKSADDEISAGQ